MHFTLNFVLNCSGGRRVGEKAFSSLLCRCNRSLLSVESASMNINSLMASMKKMSSFSFIYRTLQFLFFYLDSIVLLHIFVDS
jgi:hypothetical protein